MTLFTDIDFTTEASADNNGVPTSFTTAEESVSKPVILPNLDTLANKGQIFVQVEFEYKSQTPEDQMKMQWLKKYISNWKFPLESLTLNSQKTSRK